MTKPTTSPHLAPTSPPARGRPQNSTSPLAPLPYGGEVELEPNTPHPPPPHLAPTTGASSTTLMEAGRG